MHVGHGIDEGVVHGSLDRRSGVAHVGVEPGAGPGTSPSTLGITKNGQPIHSGSPTMAAGAGAGTPAAATAFWTSAWGARS